ncbi:MAG: formate dehydrogenase [Rubrivivax sp.]
MSDRKPTPQRRAVLGGAATVGAAAVAAAALPLQQTPAPAAPRSGDASAAPEPGYRLTDHIRQYYARARI